ncbi:Intron maturase- type II family protein [Striga hermonthica]|uniref:Intron maturase- type II family protein n=1 Tax=Striga hermonthica TaxID=68872 RepID=A0A9N7RSN5_STRHE|nr:Intron maturase- type II family protein [Striga hermonthica]
MLIKSHPLLRRIVSVEPKLYLRVTNAGRSVQRYLPVSFFSTQKQHDQYSAGDKGIRKLALAENLANVLDESSNYSVDKDEGTGKMALAKNLASVVQESHDDHVRKSRPRTRLEVKRFLEMRIKKKVKEQYGNGKFQDLMKKVIADPNTLREAYGCIRAASNVDSSSKDDNLPFESMAHELASGEFDIKTNTYSIFTRGSKDKKEKLVFPKLKLRVVQEAIRIVLEVVYRPHFSKISHGLRSGRDHCSALRYIRKEISNPDWWFTFIINKKLDDCILGKLFSSMEDKIDDPGLYAVLKDMFDANVLNMEFGGFPKGHGLPQEGILSPILMNVYLDLFDREIYRMSMHYETSYACNNVEHHNTRSKLRGWFRRQINGKCVQEGNVGNDTNVRVHCCRFMDEIFFAISGPKETALSLKSEIEGFLKNELYLEVDNNNEAGILSCGDPSGVKFVGTLIKRRLKEGPALQAVHKLKDKVKLFAEQKRESWDEGAVRIGKKWLAHGLKKVKESEIEQLADKSSVLHRISCFRKPGMKSDHWYKELLKIWLQDLRDAKKTPENSEEIILARNIVEPALPQELKDAYYEFQKQAEEYVTSETALAQALLSGPSTSPEYVTTTNVIIAPVKVVMKCLNRYGLVNQEGHARTCHVLILLDDSQIFSWFAGLVNRWLRWFDGCDNFDQVKNIISNQVRMSCVRTLAAKYRIHEREIEKKFDLELSKIPSTQEIELEEANKELVSREFKYDGALTYGINYCGLCLVSLARNVGQSRPCGCFVVGCGESASCVYTLHVMERKRFPGWKTGFSGCIHPSLHRRRMGLCRQHLVDLFLGDISLQSIDFGAWR